MQQKLIVGVDVSKATLDCCFKPSGVILQVNNDVKGFKKWLLELKLLCKSPEAVLVIMEHTGQYSIRFERFLRSKAISYCKVPAIQIKRSLGMIRGKTDKVDAVRIADYGWLRRDSLLADPLLQEDIEELRMLLSLRQKLVKDRSGYIQRLKEMKAAGNCQACDCQVSIQQQLIAYFNKQVAVLEARIKSLIDSSKELADNCRLLRSIKGVGWIVAAYMIGCTDNFNRFRCARKFNCYAGLAPFKHESGSSIKARARISHLANKTAKTLLNLAAFCAIRCDPGMNQYYHRRIAEGKQKMQCLNIIRSKIVARIFAVIKRQTPYQPFAVNIINPTLKN